MVYHVAYFLSDWNYEIVNRFLTGVTLFQAEHPDTEVHVFDNPCKYGSLELDESAFAFFRLPDINNYAGMRAVIRHVIEDHGVKRETPPSSTLPSRSVTHAGSWDGSPCATAETSFSCSETRTCRDGMRKSGGFRQGSTSRCWTTLPTFCT